MVKLIVLTQSMAGRSYDLAAERTTVGRVEDNAFQIAEPSVSSRHCEILLRGGEVIIKDLNSTNGTFINGEKITESVLKPGQMLRLGNVELKLEISAAPAPTSTPASAAPTPPKKEPVKAAARGLDPSAFESGGQTVMFDSSTIFKKKTKKKTMYFWIGAGVVFVLIIILLLVLFSQVNKSGH